MKYRDPTIRSCKVGEWTPIIKRAPAPAAPRTHQVPTPVAFQAREMPKIDRADRLPGGLPPVPYRTPWRRASDTGKGAREPFNSMQVKGEFWATKRYLEG